MAEFAAKTSVSVEKSRSEIERILERYGSDQFLYGRDDARGIATIEFHAHKRRVRFVLKLPERNERRFLRHQRGPRTPEAQLKEWEQACRQRWRALALCVKAKLEAVSSGIAEFEEEFLAYVVLPNGETAGEFLRPQIEKSYSSGRMPRPLLALPSPKGNA